MLSAGAWADCRACGSDNQIKTRLTKVAVLVVAILDQVARRNLVARGPVIGRLIQPVEDQFTHFQMGGFSDALGACQSKTTRLLGSIKNQYVSPWRANRGKYMAVRFPGARCSPSFEMRMLC